MEGGSISSTLGGDEGEEDLNLLDRENSSQEDNTTPDTTEVEPFDPNKQGAIRFVKGARLVYKRETDDGTYEELWIYKVGNPDRDEYEVRKDILAGTDIPIDKTASEDGAQSYEMWSAGDAQLIKIDGLPN